MSERMSESLKTSKKEANILLVTVDAGFNGEKCFVNRVPTFVESDCLIDNDNLIVNSFGMTDVPDDLFVLHNKTGSPIIFGKCARIEKTDNKHVISNISQNGEDIESYSRFKHDIFKYQLILSVARSLISYEKYDDSINLSDKDSMKNVVILVTVTLPHAIAKQSDYAEKIDDILVGEHELDIQLGTEKRMIYFNIKNKPLIISQAEAATIHASSNDAGEVYNKELLSRTPMLVIDAGYGTVGLIQFGTGMKYTEKDCESTPEYAMKAINSRIYEKVRSEVMKNIHFDDTSSAEAAFNTLGISRYNIEAIIASGDTERRYKKKDGTWSVINVLDYKKDIVKDIVRELLQYIENNYFTANLKQILLAGGTALAYLKDGEFISQAYDILGLNEEQIIIPPAVFGNSSEEISFVYAVAAGAHKFGTRELLKQKPDFADTLNEISKKISEQ